MNGVYTKHLLRNLTLPGLPVELVLKRVREGVSTETGGKQIPWESSSLLGDFYFKVAAVQGASAVSADSQAIEIAFWDSVKNSEAAEEFRAYLEKYPNGQFAPLARSRMNTLLATAPVGRKPSAAPPTEDTVNYQEGACAVNFGGTNQYFSIADASLDAGFPLKNGDTLKQISVSFWYRYNAAVQYACLFSKWNYSGNKRSLAVQPGNNSYYGGVSWGYGTGNQRAPRIRASRQRTGKKTIRAVRIPASTARYTCSDGA